MDELLKELRRPFTPEALQFKIQQVGPKACLVVGYIDARQVIERLNDQVPGEWGTSYKTVSQQPLAVECELTVDHCVRADVGVDENNAGPKGAYSDALKRAAVHFGVNVATYYMPRIYVPKEKMDTGKDGKLFMSKAGEEIARTRYRQWLAEEGMSRFGAPLDMGDVEDAQGDFEVEEKDTQEIETEPASEELQDEVKDAYQGLKKAEGNQEALNQLQLKLASLGKEKVSELSESEAEGVRDYLLNHLNEESNE